MQKMLENQIMEDFSEETAESLTTQDHHRGTREQLSQDYNSRGSSRKQHIVLRFKGM